MAVLGTHDLMWTQCTGPNSHATASKYAMLCCAAAHSEAAHMPQAFDSQGAFLQIILGPLLASSFPSTLCCSVAHVSQVCLSMLGSTGGTQAQLSSAALHIPVYGSP